MPINATSPLVNNPAGVAISLGKHGIRPEDLHIPESKRRRSNATGQSQSPASTVDPASVPPVVQTPVTMGTPSTYPSSTPAMSKRPSTDSPANSTLPPSKVQVGATGAVPARDRAQEEAAAKRLAKEKAEDQEREEARKDPQQYAINVLFKAMGGKKSYQPGTTAFATPPVVGLADRVRKENMSTDSNVKTTVSTPTSNPRANTDKTSPGQKAQLPSPPWSGTITPRQLVDTFGNTTDIDFALNIIYPFDDLHSSADDLGGFSMEDMLVNDEEEKMVTDELGDLDFLSPLGGDSVWDDAYSWTKNLQIPWNGDIGSLMDPFNSGVGIAA